MVRATCVGVWVWVVCAGVAWGQAPRMRVGIAGGEVTPEVGVPLAGYGGRWRETPDLDPRTPSAWLEASTGVRDPIEAQALWVEPVGGEAFAVVCVDAIGVEGSLVGALEGELRRRGVPLGEGRLVVVASHTHSGPGALSRRWFWQLIAVDRFSRRVHEEFVGALGGVVEAAWEGAEPARLGFGEVEVGGVSRNRRVPGGEVDPVLRVLRVDGEDGVCRGVVLNFAVHPTCLGEDNLEFSADVAGSIRREARERLGVPVLFTNGCLGDVSPSPGGARGLVEVGEALGEATARLAGGIETGWVSEGDVAVVEAELGRMRVHPGMSAEVEGPLGRVVEVLGRSGVRFGRPWVDTRFRCTAVRFGEVVWLGVPGEPVTALGGPLRAMASEEGYEGAWVVGLTNGHCGYLTDPEGYDRGGYEAYMTLHGRESAGVVLEALREAAARLR